MTRKPILHGRDHAHGGADPIALFEWRPATLSVGWTGEAFYRNMWDGVPELRGSISDGGSGTVAFVLPEGFRPDFDVSYVTDMAADDSFVVARVAVTAATGEVTVYFPAAADSGATVGL